MATDWNNLLTVDKKAVLDLIVCHEPIENSKLQLRGYTLPFCGTQQRCDQLIDFLRRQLLQYVFPEQERPPDIDWALGRDKFGDIDPKSDGKLGEMLLYVLVEAFLGAPLMGYKLKDLGNPNDQVKGADGVFVGEYDGQPALLVGESKIHQTLSSAVRSVIESLQRFHDNSGPYRNELMIAKKYPAERDLSPELLAAALDLLSRNSGILVHPVFVAYDWAMVASVSRDCTTPDEAHSAISTAIANELQSVSDAIDEHRSRFPKPFQVHLDFFFLPVECSMTLRNHFYEMLHGHPYESTAVRAAVKRERKKQQKTKPVSSGGET